MNTAAQSLVEELGGKHGMLEYLRSKPSLRDHIVPSIVLGHTDNYTTQTETRLRKLCSTFGCEKVIIRTSEQSDWNGMVDTMPTKNKCDIEDVPMRIEKMMEQCRHPDLLQYAKWEANGYDPNTVTFSVAPDLGGPYYTLTEHPNQKDVHLFDAVDFYDLCGKLTDALNIDQNGTATNTNGDSISNTQACITKEIISRCIALSKIAKEEANLDVADAFQFELVQRGSQQYLSQVKRFTRKRFADFLLELPGPLAKIHASPRIFGVTKEQGIDLPIARGRFRRDAQSVGEALGEPYALSPDVISDPLSLVDYPTSMLAYVPQASAGGTALAHYNTRLAKMCLDRDGVAILDMTACSFAHGNDRLTYVSDGKSWNLK